MSAGTLSLRPAVASDCALVFEWANDPVTRANSFAPAAIAWDVHCTWFGRILRDPDRRLYVILASGAPIGQARLELCGEGSVEISLSLAAAWRGRRLAAEAIRLVTAQAGAGLVHAYVKPGNDVSRRAFLSAGYVEQGPTVHKGLPAVHLTAQPVGAP
jgi:RimJ/RimL family protein N-acetyltransferase